ncbi:unnamed protein product, partial [Mesocestoides corti]
MIIGPRHHYGPVDANNTVSVVMATELFIDLPNRIIVHSLRPLTKITVNMTAFQLASNDIGLTTFNNLEATAITDSAHGQRMHIYELDYSVPIEMKPGSSCTLHITYFYCHSGECQGEADEKQVSIEKYVQFVKHFIIIMGETDKPMYRPGDQIRFRFVALSSRQIVPYSGPLTWPKYRAVGSSWNDKYLEEIGEHERDRRMKPP